MIRPLVPSAPVSPSVISVAALIAASPTNAGAGNGGVGSPNSLKTGAAIVYAGGGGGGTENSGANTFGECEQDEFGIFDDVLSAAQVTAIYNSGSPDDLSGIPYLVGYWRNGDPTGTGAFPTIIDQSSNSNYGTMENMDSSDITTNVP